MNLLAYVTIPSREEALAIARMLVQKGCAAGANMIGPVCSTYRWQGEIRQREEWLLLAQTTSGQFESLKASILASHTDKVPCIMALPITDGHRQFLDWIGASCGSSPCA